jgi:fluoroacetyl-CoA thioesterase
VKHRQQSSAVKKRRLKRSLKRRKGRPSGKALSSALRKKNTADGPQLPRLGLEATTERVVKHEWTIQMIDSRLPAVFSTPSMIGLMEHATVLAIQSEMPEGAITVGTRIEVDHLKAVGPGAMVVASARLVKYQGRFLVFDVEATSGEHLIGRGRVFRAIVHPKEHGDKARARTEQQELPAAPLPAKDFPGFGVRAKD